MADKYNLRSRAPLHKSPPETEDFPSEMNEDSSYLEPQESSPRPRPGRAARPKSARAGQRTPPAYGWKNDAEARSEDFSEDEEPAMQRTPSGHPAWNDGPGSSPNSGRHRTPSPSPPHTPKPSPSPRGTAKQFRQAADVARRSPQTAARASPGDDPDGPSPAVVLAVLVCVLAVALGVWWWWSAAALPPQVTFTGQPPLRASVSRWRDAVATLATRFPYQRLWLWKVLRASVTLMLQDARQPAVVLLLGSESQRDDMRCLLRAAAAAVLNATQSPAQPLLVDGAVLGRLDEQEAKGRLNAELDRLRGGDGVAVFVVEEVQQLQPLTAMLLHGFCDNDNAPRKEALFLLSVVTDRTPPTDRDVVVAAEHALWKAWGHVLSEDIFNALLGRIAGNVAAVTDEGSELLCRKHPL